MDEQRDFKGVWIKKEVYLDNRLSALEKIVLTEIDSLCGEDGCFCSNEYLANFCQCTTRTITEAIKKLKEMGYIKVESFDGRKRILLSCLEKTSSLPRKNCEAIPIINNINNKDINKKDAKKSSRTKESQKKTYGTFGNVRLTDAEYEKLQATFKDYERWIDTLSVYIASKGDKYKSHYATILNWYRRENGGKPNVEKEYF